MKKALVLLLSGIMAFSLFACAQNPGGENTGTAPEDRPSAESGGQDAGGDSQTDSGELYEVIMQFPTLGTTPADIQMVEDAVNERTEKEIGVHVKMYPIHAFEINTTTNLMVSSGEKLDLMMSIFEQGVASYVNKGVLIELDDLVEKYGRDIVAAEGVAMNGGYFDGKLYAVPTEEKMGRVKGFRARADLIEKYNIAHDPNKLYTYEELTEVFSTVKDGEGAGFYIIGTSGTEDAPFSYMEPVDFLGASLASGGLLNYGVGTTEVVNFFETENFASAARYARDWYQKGFFSPDCNTETDAGFNLWQTGNYLGFFSNSEPDMLLNHTRTAQTYLDCDSVTFFTSAPAAMSQFYQITLWAIPVTCENPEKTMQWLNMMYADEDMVNLLYHGIEGEHYQFVEGSDKIVEYPEGIDASTVGYQAILNVWGDKMKDYVRPPMDETYYDVMREFNASIKPEHTSDALGYCFNSEPVKTQYAAVSDVIAQYQNTLGLGVVDPDTVIPEFLDALNAAGIAEVIAENQSQFDAWRAAQ